MTIRRESILGAVQVVLTGTTDVAAAEQAAKCRCCSPSLRVFPLCLGHRASLPSFGWALLLLQRAT